MMMMIIMMIGTRQDPIWDLTYTTFDTNNKKPKTISQQLHDDDDDDDDDLLYCIAL